jgi:hypothetical protein
MAATTKESGSVINDMATGYIHGPHLLNMKVNTNTINDMVTAN